MSGRAAIAVLAALGAAGTGAGCGTDHEGHRVRGTVESFLAACVANRPDVAQRALNSSAQRVFVFGAGPTTAARCAAVIGTDPSGARVTAVAKEGAQATVVVAGRAGSGRVELEQGEEGWRIDGPTG